MQLSLRSRTTSYAGMLPWLEAEQDAGSVLAGIRSNLGEDWRARSLDEDWSSSNQIAQPLMTGVALAAWQALKNRLPRPAVVAGYSVGELAAFSVLTPTESSPTNHSFGQRPSRSTSA